MKNLMLVLGLIGASAACVSAADCDRECLRGFVTQYLGAMVAHVFSGELATGDHSFAWDANGLPPGMYECIVQMNGEVQQIPIILSR